MKEKIREFIFKTFQKQIMRICKPLLPEATLVRVKEVGLDWVKLRAQVDRPDPYMFSLRSALDAPYYYPNKEVEEKEIKWQLLQELVSEISKTTEVKKITDSQSSKEQYVIELYIANEPKY